ncbi:unnamed protein product [Agarophyton chilense]
MPRLVAINALCLALCTLLCLRSAAATARFVHHRGASRSLLQYGAAEARQHFLFELDTADTILNASLHTLHTDILSSHELEVQRISESLFNISATLFFDALPGEMQYIISVATHRTSGARNDVYSVSRNHSVYGMAFYEDNLDSTALVSGDYGNGLNLIAPEFERQSVRLKYVAYAPEGVKLHPTLYVLARGEHHSVLSEKDVRFREDSLIIRLHPGRTGSALVIVEAADLLLDGESFETVIIVRVANSPRRYDFDT